MIIYRHLLTITLIWQSSCVITNYNWKTSKIYLFKCAILLFQSWSCFFTSSPIEVASSISSDYVQVILCYVPLLSPWSSTMSELCSPILFGARHRYNTRCEDSFGNLLNCHLSTTKKYFHSSASSWWNLLIAAIPVNCTYEKFVLLLGI